MELRPLGRTGIAVSPIGLGTVKLGRNRGVKFPEPFALPDDAAIDRLLGAAGDFGVNLLDTAPAYGTSEERLGRALRGRRDDWVIATKCGEEFVDGDSRFDFSAPALEASVERSLRRLATDRLDLVLVHSDGNDVDIIERFGALETLARLKRRGLVRAVGISTKTIAGGLAALDGSDVVMVTYSPAATDDAPVIDRARDAGVGVLVKKALASGHLDRIGGADPVADAMRFVFDRPGVTSVVVGTLDADHLAADVAACARALAPATVGGPA